MCLLALEILDVFEDLVPSKVVNSAHDILLWNVITLKEFQMFLEVTVWVWTPAPNTGQIMVWTS